MDKHVKYRFCAEQQPVVSACDLANVKPPYIHFRRKYAEYIIYVILSGEMQIIENEIEYILKENDVLLLDPAYVHYGTRPIGCSFYYIHFTFPGFVSETNATSFFPKCYHLENANSIQRIHQIFERIRFYYPKPEPLNQAMINCLCHEFLIQLASDYSNAQLSKKFHTTSRIREVLPDLMHYLQTDYSAHISGELLQEKYHYHFDYLNRQFKRYTGDNIFRYLTKIRIEKAKELLLIGYYTQEEIANQTGFCDSFYFSKVFKKEMGITPCQWKSSQNYLEDDTV